MGISENRKPMNFFGKHKKLAVFAISFLVVFVYTNLAGVQQMMHDSWGYEDMSRSFMQSGSFRLTDYPDTYRGVVLPLLLFLFDAAVGLVSSNPMMGWRVLISLLLAALMVVLPALFEKIAKQNIHIVWYFVPLALILFFWYGLINYKLSDLVALILLLLGMAALLQVMEKPKAKWWVAAALSFLAGVLLYAAYNTRTIYLFPAVFFVPAVLLYGIWGKRITWRKALVVLFCIVAGVFALGSLEGVVNWHHHGRFTIEMINQGLFRYQFEIGLLYAQKETYLTPEDLGVAGEGQYPGPVIYFMDPVGMKVSEYAAGAGLTAAMLRYPLEVLGVYLRHFINYLNPVWGGGSYITNVYALKIHRSLLNYVMLFLAAKQLLLWARGNSLRGMWEKAKQYGAVWIVALTLLAPCAAILPGAPEIRFFLPAYLLLYGLVAYCVDFKAIWADVKARPWSNGLLFVGVFVLLCAGWATTYALTDAGMVLSIW